MARRKSLGGTPPQQGSVRESVLMQAVSLTCGDRDAVYGPPAVNLACAAELIEVYQRYRDMTGRSTNSAHDISMFNVLQKVARIATGELKEDNYIDGAAYFAIAYEVEAE